MEKEFDFVDSSVTDWLENEVDMMNVASIMIAWRRDRGKWAVVVVFD